MPYKGLLDQYMHRTPREDDALAVSQDGLGWSHAELHRLSSELCSTIRGVHTPGSGNATPIAVGCGRSVEQIVALLAIWKMEGIYMPVNLERDIHSLGSYLESTRVRLLICHKADLEDVIREGKDVLQTIICFYSPTQWEVVALQERVARPFLELPLEGSGQGYLVRTSGSTGLPKIVYGRSESVDHFITWQSKRFVGEGKPRTAWLTEPTFDASFRDIFLPLVHGGTVCIPPQHVRELSSALIQWIHTQEITHLHMVPSFYRILLREIEDGYKGLSLFGKLKHVFLSGEAVMPSDVNRWHDLFGTSSRIVNFYGSTETTLIRTCHEFLTTVPEDQAIVPVGRAMADTVISIMDGGSECKPGERGQVIVHTRFPTHGYYEEGRIRLPWEPTLDSQGMVSYTTGDTGYVDHAGNLFIEGRNDDEIKVRGIRINLKSIEWMASQLPFMKSVKVIHDEGKDQLNLFFTSDSHVDIDHGRAELLQLLPEAHVPRKWIHLDRLPIGENGKVDVVKLKAYRVETESEAGEANVWQDQEERKLAILWSEVLSADVRYRTDNFFDLGGNSLNGMLLVSKIQKEFNRQVRIRDLFMHPILHDMLEMVKKAPFKVLAEIPRIDASPHYPLSAAQRRMWVLHNMERNSITYNIKRAYEISGEIDIDRLEKAFHHLIESQESLRTNLMVREGVPVQFVRGLHEHLFKLRILDLTSEKDIHQAIRVIANNEVHHSFQLEQESLIRATLIGMGKGKHVLLLNLHHIITDGWSMEILMKSLLQDYHHDGNGGSDPSPVIQYRDYAHWQNDMLVSGALQKQKEYWLKEFEGDIPKLELPTDKRRAGIKTYEGKPIYFTLDRAVKEQILAICARLDVSLFMFLLSVTKLLLHKYSGQTDLVIGSPVAGRQHPSLSRMIGFFVNMVALRTSIDPDSSFENYLLQVREKVLDGFDHQAYPFDQLVEDLDLPREAGRSPLFDITFQVLNVEFWEDSAASDLSIKPFITDWERSQFDLSFFFKERQADIFGLIEFNTDLHEQERIIRLINHFKVLLGEVLSHMDMPVGRLTYLSSQERRALRYGFNERSVSRNHEGNILEFLRSSAGTGPVLVGGKEEMTYAQLASMQSQIARFIARQGLRREVIAVLSDKRSSILPAMMGIMASGNIYLPLDPRHPLDRMLDALAGIDARMILYDLEHIDRADKLMWGLESVMASCCLDSEDQDRYIPEGGELMRKDLWNYVGESAKDQIQSGGWISSYTGEPFSREEMEEYAENALFKLLPHIHSGSRVLEIGCSSGITLLKVAPMVRSYLGTDLSPEILKHTRKQVEEAGLQNVDLRELAAHDLLLVEEGAFDVVIVNSVIQSFGSYNYFKDVLEKILAKVNDSAILFLGDIQDITLRKEMISSLRHFSQRNQGRKQRTKLVWDDELFFHPQYFRDLAFDHPALDAFEFSKKRGQLVNELTLFRYDLLIRIEKSAGSKPALPRAKGRFGKQDLQSAAHTPLPEIAKDDTAYIIFTSGTTGVPKGVEVSHGALVNQIAGFQEVYRHRLNASDRFLLTSKPTFDVSILEMFLGLSSGGTLVEMDDRFPIGADSFVRTIHEHAVSWAYLPPSLLRPIFESFRDRGYASPLKYLLVGVEPIPFEVLGFIHSLYPGLEIVNGYGPTEAAIVSTFYRFNPKDVYERVPIGGPMFGYEIFVVDADLELVGIGIPGQIAIAGRGLAKGYRNSKTQTEEKFVYLQRLDRTVYLTGDVAYWDRSGNLTFVGRNDDQVKFNGYRIELSDVDTQIKKFPGVKASISRIIPVDEFSNQLVSFVMGPSILDEGEVKRFLSALLPAYMVPNRVIVMEQFPLTSHGKIDHDRLKGSLRAHGGRSDDSQAPRTASEEILHRLFRSILNREDIGIDDNFFDLGGHSLLATRLITKAAKEEQIELQLVDVFTHPTVRELGTRVKRYDHVARAMERIAEDPRGIYPVSFGQERLWVIDQLNPDDPAIRSAYNMVGLFRVEGLLPADLFQRAIQLLVIRHESLRTNFISDEGVPLQIVHPHRTFTLDHVELYGTDPGHADLLSAVEELAFQPFDLENDILFRVILIQGRRDQHALTVMHHIVSDGWSMHRFSLELAEAIRVIEAGKTRLPGLPIHYKDYSAWQKGRVQELSKAKAYWEGLLKEWHEPTVIPGDFNRPIWRSFYGDTLSVDLTEHDSQRIRQYCSDRGVTLFALLNAALHVLIHRCTGLETVTTGSPVSGRVHPMLEEQIGFYLNNIVVRTALRGEEHFRDYLAGVHSQLTQSLHHQEYPFDLLVEELSSENDPAHSPFFDIYLALQNNQDPILDFGPFKFHEVPMDRKVSRFDLNFMVGDGERLKLTLQFNTDLYRRDTACSLVDAFRNILLHVTNDQPLIRDIRLMDSADMQRLVHMPHADLTTREGKTADGKARNLVDAFRRMVERYPSRPALTFDGKDWTYEDLDHASSHLAWRIIEKKNDTATPVALDLERGVARVIAILAVLKSGSPFLPLDPKSPRGRKAFLLRDAQCALLINEGGETTDDVETIPYALNLEPVDSPDQAMEGDRIAYVLYTSGTTGTPKGVMVTHANVLSLIVDEPVIDISQEDVWTLFHQYYFDFSVWEMWGALLHGGRLVVLSDDEVVDPEMVAEVIGREGVTILNQTPMVFYLVKDCLIRKYEEKDLALRQVIFGGDKLTPSLLLDFAQRFPSVALINMYGITETTIHVTAKLLDQGALQENVSNIGRAIPSLSVFVVDRYGQLLPKGIPGQLVVAGMGVSRGYLNDPGQTEQKFTVLPFLPEAISYWSGDKAKWLPNDELEYLGRIDAQLKVRGHRMEASEIERALESSEWVRKAVAIKVNEGADEQLLGFIEPVESIQRIMEAERSFPELQLTRLPNGMPFFQMNESETRFMYKEIIEDDGYRLRETKLQKDPVIIDAGANIGMFTLHASRIWPTARIHSFEPIPQVYACLQANMQCLETGNVKIYNEGLSGNDGELVLTYYPFNTVMSGAGEFDQEILGSYLEEHYGLQGEADRNDIEVVVKEALSGVAVHCPVRSISSLIDAEGMERIDLLKVDVEDWEEKIIQGVESRHWPIIRHVIMEVHDKDGRLAAIRDQLTERGFTVSFEQTQDLTSTALYNLFAWREVEKPEGSPITPPLPAKERYPWKDAAELPSLVRDSCIRQLPAYMVPDEIIPVERIPITRNGKVDRARLLELAREKRVKGEESHTEVSRRGRIALDILEEVLARGIALADNFFQSGGNSLNATRVTNRVKEALSVDLKVRDLFKYPVISDLLVYIDQLGVTSIPVLSKSKRKDNFPVTHAQHQILATEMIQGAEGTVYNMTGGMRLDGTLRLDLLMDTFRLLLERYEILRTSFHFHEGEFVQRIHPQVPVPFHVVQVEEVTDRSCREKLEALNKFRFRLDQLPLFRVEVFAGADDQYFLALVMHHIISDGWSMSILNNEVAQIYRALSEGRSSELRPLRYQFKDYSDWHHSILNNQEWLTSQAAFWGKELMNAPALNLPYDFRSAGERTFQGKSIQGRVKGWEPIQHTLSEMALTDFSFLLACVHTVLKKVCDQEDFIIGSPVAGRPLAELEDQMGFFVNTLPIRIGGSGDPSIRELISDVQQKFTGLLEHQVLPYDLIMESGRKATGTTPSVNVLMVYQNNTPLNATMDGVRARKIDFEMEGALFDLVLNFSPTEGNLDLRVQYNAVLFESQTVRELTDLLLEAIMDLPRDMDRSISEATVHW